VLLRRLVPGSVASDKHVTPMPSEFDSPEEQSQISMVCGKPVTQGNVEDSYSLDYKLLGEGSFGVVRRARHKETGASRVIKDISIDNCSRKDIEREVMIHSNVDHPHIVNLFETFRDKDRYSLVLEMCNDDLFDRIVGEGMQETDAAQIMSQILGAVQYLHGQKIAHRDIKLENILLAESSKLEGCPIIKLIDFGLATQFEPGTSKLLTKCGSVQYVAPQVLQCSKGSGYNEKCDIWSCGVVMYCVISGLMPFFGRDDYDVQRKVVKGKYDFPDRGWGSVSKEAKDVINKMLTVDPNERPSAAELMSDPWMSFGTKAVTRKAN